MALARPCGLEPNALDEREVPKLLAVLNPWIRD
jgi:hypothetical protein